MNLKRIISKTLNIIIPINNHQITFESLNDLDCNSGALYNFMLDNKLNEKYKIIWLLKNSNIDLLPKIKNVEYIPYSNNKNIIKKIKLRRSKYLIWDNVPIVKYSQRQKSIYLTHGFPAMKNVHGIINVPKDCDYVIATSKKLVDHAKYQFSISENTKFIFSGLPRNDYLFNRHNEIKKFSTKKYNKVIMWMPTFRKAKNSSRNDSNKEFKYGIPLIKNEKELNLINDKLLEYNDLLIIKIHGGQDINFEIISGCSNIIVITLDDEKKLKINLYKLLSDTDALISDYSSVSFDYLLTNNPIGYVIDDMKDYKLGFGFEKPLDYMPGKHILKFNDLLKFIDNLNNNIDEYQEKRKEVLNKINDYQDNENCKRIFDIIDGEKL